MNGLGDDEAYLRDPSADDRSYYGAVLSAISATFSSGLFGQPQRQVFPPSAGGYGNLRSRSPEDRRWFPPRRVDPDVRWRDYQRGVLKIEVGRP
jgi:hypothetical protein